MSSRCSRRALNWGPADPFRRPDCDAHGQSVYPGGDSALHQVFGKDTVFIRSGGSIPIVGDFERHLNIPTVMMGFGLPDDNLHAPNEKFHIANFHRGIESVILFFEDLGGGGSHADTKLMISVD